MAGIKFIDYFLLKQLINAPFFKAKPCHFNWHELMILFGRMGFGEITTRLSKPTRLNSFEERNLAVGLSCQSLFGTGQLLYLI